MLKLANLMKICGLLIIAAGLSHVLLGLRADALLGAKIPPELLSEPSLESNNGFYGGAFLLFGFLFIYCATDIEKYQTVIKITLFTFLLAGLSRLPSIFAFGMPSTKIVGLTIIEILGAPILLYLLRKELKNVGKTPGSSGDSDPNSPNASHENANDLP